MTEAEALKALIGMGLTRKMAAFLLSDAKKYGGGAHLKCEVTYASGLGYVIVNYDGGNACGRWINVDA